jgi:hypothetical protein
MRVRILSGALRGAVVEMGQREAEANVATGFAELVPEVPVVVADEPAPMVTVAATRRRARRYE